MAKRSTHRVRRAAATVIGATLLSLSGWYSWVHFHDVTAPIAVLVGAGMLHFAEVSWHERFRLRAMLFGGLPCWPRSSPSLASSRVSAPRPTQGSRPASPRTCLVTKPRLTWTRPGRPQGRRGGGERRVLLRTRVPLQGTGGPGGGGAATRRRRPDQTGWSWGAHRRGSPGAEACRDHPGGFRGGNSALPAAGASDVAGAERPRSGQLRAGAAPQGEGQSQKAQSEEEGDAS